MKIALLILLAFPASAAAVVAGYTPFLGVFKSYYWTLAVQDLPVFEVAAVNTAAAFFVLFAAFWSSRGNSQVYYSAILGYSFLLPFLLVFVFLPGAQSKPTWASLNPGVVITAFFIVQFTVARSLREWFWNRGGRSAA